MNLLQKICNAVVNASDAFGASMQGLDVKTHRANLYGHPDGIVAARVAAPAGDARQAADLDDANPGAASMAPFYAARTSDIPLYQTLAEDLENEARETRWRDLDDVNRSVDL